MLQVGKLFVRIIPQARNRGYMMISGFDPSVNQKTMTRYTTLSGITQQVIDKAVEELAKMQGAKEVINVTKGDVEKKLMKLFERQALNGRLLARWTY
jgi:hypothetical protein